MKMFRVGSAIFEKIGISSCLFLCSPFPASQIFASVLTKTIWLLCRKGIVFALE